MTEPRTFRGMVALVGAGPGDDSLLTQAGARLVSIADIVIYDRLAHPSILRLCRPDAEKIYVGKVPGSPENRQSYINELLVRHGKTGKFIVRLKGGDCYLFGRGGEETLALSEAGIPFMVIPGVTAALAAGAFAGIPLTDRRYSSSVAFVTGQEDPTKPDSDINWAALAGVDTLVFYMGVKNLPDISKHLLAAGRAADTPVAVVAQAASPHQRVLISTLANVPADAERNQVKPPALTIIGDVVRLYPRLAWFEKLPLFGQTVLVTSPPGELGVQLADAGAAVIESPSIQIAPPEDFAPVDAALRELGRYDLVVFTSARGVRAMVERCGVLGLDARALGRCRIAAVGPETADALRQAFLRPDFVPESFTTEALGQLLSSGVGGKRVLLARADIATHTLPDLLRAAGATVDEAAFYRTLAADELPEEAVEALRTGGVNWITFTSASTVTNFLALLERHQLPATLLHGVKLASIGPVTTEALAQAGLKPTVTAETFTVPGLVEAMIQGA